MQIWGCAKPSQTRIIQAFQSTTLRQIVPAFLYLRNQLISKFLHKNT
ncbi:zinc finger MYM-type protein 6-like [Aphis craccivora]|uniref:Zinc finger MYM-type protein 6-like n=1 Tax=Aphis craccivora TaxID=307492 RepID=A0A6G0Z6A2_APHCR|nr:zinc finger MYM-type protein 6-like [Aphis craccivora]